MTAASRPSWDFDYRPISSGGGEEVEPCDVVVALEAPVPIERVVAALGAGVRVAEVLAEAPLFWVRVAWEAGRLDPDRVAGALRGIGAGVRYVAPARTGSQRWAPVLDVARAAGSGAAGTGAAGSGAGSGGGWAVRGASEGAERRDGGCWFLAAEGGGVAVERGATGTGAGTRLAVIDDDAQGAELLDLDAEVLIGLAQAPRAQAHGALMVGWAAGAARAAPPFRGVAQDTSPRLYLIPKPGADVVALPLAIVRAVRDGADVVVCATYVEGAWSPMLDDALAFAERIGRGGRGAVVVLPTGRETSSPPGSVHASLSLSFGDPAADPRVLCVAPAARAGGWFFYRDRKRLARPFANRGPSVRFLAPGDDIASPLGGDRLSHAESSGASAIAAGVVLLVLARNPSLRLREVHALLEATLSEVPPAADPALAPFADAHDTRPPGADRDGHNAKHGYGALHAERACLAAADPVAWAFVRIGELGAARAYAALRAADAEVREAYSPELARWMVRALLTDARASHAARSLARHARLLSVDRRRLRAAAPGALARQVALLLRGLVEGTAVGPPPPLLRNEIDTCLERLARGAHAMRSGSAASAPGAPLAAGAEVTCVMEEAWAGVCERLFDPVQAPLPVRGVSESDK